ncbi:hypothetical protein JCM15765_06960 [Paradesulfitobacterium aromaticivorans]
MCAQVNRAMMKKMASDGIVPGETLVAPQVFSQAAQIENLPLEKFIGNETKIPLALEKLQAHLKLGCMFSAISNDLSDTTFRVSLETLNRLRTRFRDSQIIGMVLPGPFTAGGGKGASDWNNASWNDVLDAGADRLSHVLRTYCERDPDFVIVREEELPTGLPEFWPQWQDVMESLGNIISYYQVLPIVMANNGHLTEISQAINECPGFVPAFHQESVPAMQAQGILAQRPWVLALDLDFPDRQLGQEVLVKDALSGEARRNLVMVTTDREIPHNISVGKLPGLVQRMKSLVS